MTLVSIEFVKYVFLLLTKTIIPLKAQKYSEIRLKIQVQSETKQVNKMDVFIQDPSQIHLQRKIISCFGKRKQSVVVNILFLV